LTSRARHRPSIRFPCLLTDRRMMNLHCDRAGRRIGVEVRGASPVPFHASKPHSPTPKSPGPGEDHHPLPRTMIHVHVKTAGRIPDSGGWRAHSRASTQHRDPAGPRPVVPEPVTPTRTRPSTVTPDWPTPKLCPMRPPQPRPGTSTASCPVAGSAQRSRTSTRVERRTRTPGFDRIQPDSYSTSGPSRDRFVLDAPREDLMPEGDIPSRPNDSIADSDECHEPLT
jgi:hypothetical protein